MLKHLYGSLYSKSNTIAKRSVYHVARILDVESGKYNESDKVQIQGWVKAVRKTKENVFLDVNDGTSPSNLQLVVSKLKLGETAYGSSVDVKGTLKQTPKDQLELNVDTLQELGGCTLSDGYPFYPKKAYPPEYIRNHLHLRARTAAISSTLRVRHRAIHCINQFLDQEGFIQVHAPVITSNDCEGAGEAFKVKPASEQLTRQVSKNNSPLEDSYFNGPAFLTVSGQLHLEAICHALSKVYSFGPTFRAENCKSPIHLSEFYMLELEEAFMDTTEALMNRIESLVKTVTRSLLNSVSPDIDLVRKLTTQSSLEKDFAWLEKPFPRITYREAIDILKTNQGKLKGAVQAESGINKEQELFLVDYHQSPVFVERWPKEIKSFYMREYPNDSSLVDGLDFLVPHVGELVGGSLRENDYNRLKEKLPDHDALGWYLDLRKFGSVPTGGFGLGLERYLSWILHVHNVRDVIPFPRWAHNCPM
ncbi:probable asparagine--tRNA ligase, mitochondrial [Sabethes cyaneus]|uniref:probable asparagine--tRNA ligase, mitochondrial n=1 Tax=Sabethes cyaneus TaxID=53552 RepID=UPI00237D8CF7|nr:probable asparagine--tRNA ligase, mitochondrial [Sabethes cyaneus]